MWTFFKRKIHVGLAPPLNYALWNFCELEIFFSSFLYLEKLKQFHCRIGRVKPFVPFVTT